MFSPIIPSTSPEGPPTLSRAPLPQVLIKPQPNFFGYMIDCPKKFSIIHFIVCDKLLRSFFTVKGWSELSRLFERVFCENATWWENSSPRNFTKVQEEKKKIPPISPLAEAAGTYSSPAPPPHSNCFCPDTKLIISLSIPAPNNLQPASPTTSRNSGVGCCWGWMQEKGSGSGCQWMLFLSESQELSAGS